LLDQYGGDEAKCWEMDFRGDWHRKVLSTTGEERIDIQEKLIEVVNGRR
jgi:hypothetical protein